MKSALALLLLSRAAAFSTRELRRNITETCASAVARGSRAPALSLARRRLQPTLRRAPPTEWREQEVARLNGAAAGAESVRQDGHDRLGRRNGL